MAPQRDVERRRRLLLPLAVAVVLGVLGMHGLSLHAGHAMGAGAQPSAPMAPHHATADHATADRATADDAGGVAIAQAAEAMAPMLCALMLAGGVLLLLRRPARGLLGLLGAVVPLLRAAPARALVLPGAHGPPPPPWRHSVVRC